MANFRNGRNLGLLAVFCSTAHPLFAQEKNVPIPKVESSNWKIELVDFEPGIVTPTACDVDKNDNLYVVECHTHFPPDNYKGPKTDRIWVYIDQDHDGKFERRELFYEGGVATMSLVCAPDGWVYASSRSQIIRLKDDNNDFKADTNQRVIQHDTKANYPHNGLSSLMLVGTDEVMFGQGENFGEPYRVVGTDGSVQVGGGEGGNVYICKRDGSKVRRFATGFWNPFGMARHNNELYIVDNDPDATPPNRLLNVIESGDYGFQFRFGRAGTNPLLSWNGEYPGTLGMAAGVGEAACAVQPIGDALYVSSWGDNRIERFSTNGNVLGPAETFVQGTSMFRPVDFAVNSKGVVYVTDWVDRDYKVHSKGRIWKLTHSGTDVKTAGNAQVNQIGKSAASSATTLWHRLDKELRTYVSKHKNDTLDAATKRLEASVASDAWNAKDDATRAKLLAELYEVRWTWLTSKTSYNSPLTPAVRELIEKCIKSPNVELRLLAIRFGAESGDKELLPTITDRLKAGDLAYRQELGPVVAAISYLSSGQAAGARLDPAREKVLSGLLLDNQTAIEVQIYAMAQLSPLYRDIDMKKLTAAVLEKNNPNLTHSWISWLAARGDRFAKEELMAYVNSSSKDEEGRADALAAVASLDKQSAIDLYNSSESAKKSKLLAAEASRVQNSKIHEASEYPDRSNIDAWLKQIDQKGDSKAGWRVWTRSQCVKCHALDGRGATVGPDLAAIAKGTSREQLLTSILQPSKEIAPLYVTWKVLTTDGKVILGSKVNGGGVGESNRYLLSDGTTVDIAQGDIEEQQAVGESIMPDNVAYTLSVQEIADLMAMFSSMQQKP